MQDRTDILFPELELEMLRMGGMQEADPKLRAQLDEDLRLAVLFSRDTALVPAPGFFETYPGYEVVRRFAPSVERGQLALLGSGGHPTEYADRKLRHWADDHQQLNLYGEQAERRMAALDGQGWRAKHSSTDVHLVQMWQQNVEDGSHPLLNVWRRSGMRAAAAEDAVARVPQRLDGVAIVVDNITRRLPPKVLGRMTVSDTHNLRILLAGGFFRSYLDEGQALALVDSRLAGSSAIRAAGVAGVHVRRLRLVLQALGLTEPLTRTLSHAALAQLVDTPVWQTVRPDLVRRAQASTPFTAEELVALRRARSPGKLRTGREVPVLEQYLERVAVALARPVRRRAGESSNSGQIELFKTQGRTFMSGTHFHGQTTINGNVINWEGGGELDAHVTPVPEVLAAVLPGVLRASSPTDAERLLRSVETLVTGRKVERDEVAEVVQGQLANEVQAAHPAVRRRLVDLGTGAAAEVIAQGITLGIKALAGG